MLHTFYLPFPSKHRQTVIITHQDPYLTGVLFSTPSTLHPTENDTGTCIFSNLYLPATFPVHLPYHQNHINRPQNQNMQTTFRFYLPLQCFDNLTFPYPQTQTDCFCEFHLGD